MADISAFKAQMIQGGARANQFRVSIQFPTIVPNGALAGRKLEFLAKSAQLPQSSLSEVQVMYRGRPVYFAGEREFDAWSIEVYNDNDFVVRNAFEAWVDSIQNSANTNGIQQPALYQVDMSVIQTDRNDREVKRYIFKDAFPTVVGAIQLDWDQNNQIEVFPVSFRYNYFESPTSQGALG
jgi:hypothetical protein